MLARNQEMRTSLLEIVVRELETLFSGVVVEIIELDADCAIVLDMRLRDVVLELDEVDEDSMAFASAIETFAFPLAKLVTQTLI